MSAQNGRRGFRAADRARVLAQAAGKPTGVLLEIGGQTIDLVAVPVGELLGVLDLLEKLSALVGTLGTGALTQDDAVALFAVLGKDGARFVALVRSVLERSAFYGDADATLEDRALFGEWFALLDPGELLRTVLPKLTEATMLSVNPPKATSTTSAAPPAESFSVANSS